MSELHIPPEVADAMRALRPELRKKLSLYDIDCMTKPFRSRIRELEEALASSQTVGRAAGAVMQYHLNTIARLRGAIAAHRVDVHSSRENGGGPADLRLWKALEGE